jgi:hypothetical protein
MKLGWTIYIVNNHSFLTVKHQKRVDKYFFAVQERYTAFLRDAQQAAMKVLNGEGDGTECFVKTGTVKVGALLPHEVTMAARACYVDRLNMSTDTYDRQKMEFDLQWNGLTQNLLHTTAGNPTRCWVPVCDVSASMQGQPMEVAIALSLLLAEVNRPESGWYGKMFTFETEPELVDIFKFSKLESTQVVSVDDSPKEGMMNKLRDIGDAAFRVSEMEWGGSTDILKTMRMFCETAVNNKTTIEEMKHHGIVIFSDMEFDDATDGTWDTIHEKIVTLFQEVGYPTVPRIIYWNLRASRSTPVAKDTKGVVLLSGFSPHLLNCFLEGDLREFTPMAQLRAVLDKPAYALLRTVE